MRAFFIQIFNIFLHKPLFNALLLLYLYLPGHDFGVAVIALTILIRILLFPFMAQSLRSQKILSELQPKIQEIQQRFKDDKEKQTRAIMELYQKEKINPFGGMVPIFVQFPILIGLYRVFWNGLSSELLTTHRYSFIPNPGAINHTFLGLMDLTKPSLLFAILAGVSQFLQSKMMMPKTKSSDLSQAMQKQMLYFFPLLTVLILWKLPAAIGLYWTVTSLFSIAQQHFILKKQNIPTQNA